MAKPDGPGIGSVRIALHSYVTVREVFPRDPGAAAQAGNDSFGGAPSPTERLAWPCSAVRMSAAPLSAMKLQLSYHELAGMSMAIWGKPLYFLA